MVICPDCGKDVKEAKFCSNCGANLPKIEKISIDIQEDVGDDVMDADFQEEFVVDDVNVPEEVINGTEGSTEETNDVKKSKFCPNCGQEVGLDVAFCPNCGFSFVQEETTQTKFCQSCGKKININAEICPYCGVRVAGVSLGGEKSVALAAILSFLFPGLGHIYNGLTKKGISFIVVYVISAVLILLLIGAILALIVWIWALIDAIKTTEAINRGEFVEDKLF